MPTTVAIVPAAGSGERLGAGIPKAFVPLDDRTMLDHAVNGLLASGVVEQKTQQPTRPPRFDRMDVGAETDADIHVRMRQRELRRE